MSKDDKTAAIAPENNSDATQVLSATEEATEVVPQAPVAGSVDSTELVDSEETAVMGSNDATAVIGNQYAPDQTQAVPVSNRGHIGAAAPVRLQVGDVLKERFELKRKLGEGGMGAVFLAIDRRKVEAQHQKPEVALKLIHGEFAKDSRAFIALQRETDKSQTLAHPNIITVYDFDRDGDTFFMTMEALTGTELSSLIKQASSDRRQYISFIEDLAKGIAYAHQRNIVHSDLKPANIFITQDQKLKILDFGIARALAGVDGNVDRSGEVSGLTPGYASCEMFERQDPHPADDVYAIGLIAYEVLTGEHPYGRKKSIDARKEGLKPKKSKGFLLINGKQLPGH